MLKNFLDTGYIQCMNQIMTGCCDQSKFMDMLNEINDVAKTYHFPTIDLGDLSIMAERAKELNLYDPQVIIKQNNDLNGLDIGTSAIRFVVNRRPMMYYTSHGYLIDITPVGTIVYDDFTTCRYINVFGSDFLKTMEVVLTIPARVQQYDVPFKVLLSYLCSNPIYGHIFKFLANDMIINKLYANSDILQVLFKQHVDNMENNKRADSRYLNLLFIINGFNIIHELVNQQQFTFTKFRERCFNSFVSYGG